MKILRELLKKRLKFSRYQHGMRSARIRSFSGPYFPSFGLNTDQKNSKYRPFLRSANNEEADTNSIFHAAMINEVAVIVAKDKDAFFLLINGLG